METLSVNGVKFGETSATLVFVVGGNPELSLFSFLVTKSRSQGVAIGAK